MKKWFTDPKEYFDMDSMPEEIKKEVLYHWKEFRRYFTLGLLCKIGIRNALDAKQWDVAFNLFKKGRISYRKATDYGIDCEKIGKNYLRKTEQCYKDGTPKNKTLVHDYWDYETSNMRYQIQLLASHLEMFKLMTHLREPNNE